jgi:hypothetical protein
MGFPSSGRPGTATPPGARGLCGWNECGNALDGADDGRPRGDLLVPGCDIGRIREIKPGKLPAPQPAEMRDVSDGEAVARGIFGLGQDAIEDGEHTFGLRLKRGGPEHQLRQRRRRFSRRRDRDIDGERRRLGRDAGPKMTRRRRVLPLPVLRRKGWGVLRFRKLPRPSSSSRGEPHRAALTRAIISTFREFSRLCRQENFRAAEFQAVEMINVLNRSVAKKYTK